VGITPQGTFRVTCTVDGVSKRFGIYEHEVQAALVYDELAKKHIKDPVLNFIVGEDGQPRLNPLRKAPRASERIFTVKEYVRVCSHFGHE
jgi:hypothetical protein